MSVDTIYQRMEDDTEKVFESKGDSELTKFYEGLSVFVTGPTDTLGKCLVNKLIRDCPATKIYALIRVRKTEDFTNKCEKFYRDNVFDNLREINPNFKESIVPIKGDLCFEKLSLSDEDYKTITENVQLIYHNGGSKKLDEQITVALRTNVLGTKHMLDLAQNCKRLKAFVYVSTAFSHCHQRIIEEKFYRSPADLKTVDDMLEADKYGLTKEALKMLMGEWPNVYTFTTATAEDLLQRQAARSSFACSVFRPSVVISAYKDPRAGWCDSKNGPAKFFAKIAKGAIHVVYNTDYPCDLIPVDLSVNALLVTTWDAVDRWQTEPEAFVYNYGTSHERPITFRQIREKIKEDPNAFVSSTSKRKPYVIFASNLVVYFLLRIIIDYIPALILDAIALVHGDKPESWSLVRESMYDMCRIHRFANGIWRVRINDTLKACDKLNPRDRELFFCDVRSLDWDDYFLTYWRGVRVNVLKESLEPGKRCCKCTCLALTIAVALVGLYFLSTLFL